MFQNNRDVPVTVVSLRAPLNEQIVDSFPYHSK